MQYPMNFRPTIIIILQAYKFLTWNWDKNHILNNISMFGKRYWERSAQVKNYEGQSEEIFLSNFFKAAEKLN